jgi:hypothetical protein
LGRDAQLAAQNNYGPDPEFLVTIARAPKRMAALDGGAFFARHVILDVAGEFVGAAAKTRERALDQLRVLERGAVDFLRGALGRALRKAQELEEIMSRGKRAASRSGIHRRAH